MSVFPREQILLVKSEEYFSDRLSQVDIILKFLDIGKSDVLLYCKLDKPKKLIHFCNHPMSRCKIRNKVIYTHTDTYVCISHYVAKASIVQLYSKYRPMHQFVL